MSRRTLLTSEQRIRLFGIPTDSAELAKHYVLSSEDLAFIRTKRRSGNRLGFAVQLCPLRHPGQGLVIGEHPPEEMIAFIAHQLGDSPATFAEYALRDQTRREHAIELQKLLFLRHPLCLYLPARTPFSAGSRLPRRSRPPRRPSARFAPRCAARALSQGASA